MKRRHNQLIIFLLLLAACSSSAVDQNAGEDVSTENLLEGVESSARTLSQDIDSCAEIAQAFTAFSDLVSVSCDADYIYVHSPSGLPDSDAEDDHLKSMVGIRAWILRVPILYDYQWRIPVNPQWIDAYEEASAKGPIAFAANGVPIFHYERRPDVSTDPSNYDPGSDTVVQGELDQCGGHSGQGDDYHYHYVPICLLNDMDISQPIAFGLDGVPIYFGTGGSDFFGSGIYSEFDNLPDGDLDECNAYQLEDGSYVYYTTKEPPYVLGCHRAHFDSSLQIEPRPLDGREQGNPGLYGGQVGEAIVTLITDFYIAADGWRHLEHQAFTGSGTSAVIYRQSESGNDCWDFEFREDVKVAGTMESYCR
jgi:hypothetical protein